MPYINPISAPTATADNWGATAAPSTRSTELDKDAFLKLLVAQLKYQDPLSPADPQEFMSQTAQFTSVEKLEQIAKQTSEQTWALSLSTASSLVGRQVTYLRTDGTTGTGVATSALTDPSGIVLNIGAEQVPLGAITEIATPATAR